MAAWRANGLPEATIELIAPDAVGPTIVDVRQLNEYQAAHIPGAIPIELGALLDAPIPEGALTLMCGHGERAMTGAAILEQRGRHDLAVLAGGPDDWSAHRGTPLETSE
jgi:rhodanese-related sulfurtransferase